MTTRPVLMPTQLMQGPTAPDQPMVTGGLDEEIPAVEIPVPFTAEECDAIQSTIWGDLEGDPRRFDQLLAVAFGTLAGIALDGQTEAAALCVRVLREMEQRALWGPDHEQEDHR